MKKYLNEERYQKNKKVLTIIGTIVLLIGFSIGGSLLVKGLIKNNELNFKFSEENRINVKEKIEKEKKELDAKRLELINEGIVYNSFAKYTDGKEYDLKIITDALNNSYCGNELEENELTENYCNLKNEYREISDESNNNDSEIAKFISLGIWSLLLTLIIGLPFLFTAKGREMMAYQVQEMMPIAKEGFDEMIPVAKKATEEMAPSIGKVAKEVAKGIKEGIKEEE